MFQCPLKTKDFECIKENCNSFDYCRIKNRFYQQKQKDEDVEKLYKNKRKDLAVLIKDWNFTYTKKDKCNIVEVRMGIFVRHKEAFKTDSGVRLGKI
jgi:hypothetical protein